MRVMVRLFNLPLSQLEESLILVLHVPVNAQRSLDENPKDKACQQKSHFWERKTYSLPAAMRVVKVRLAYDYRIYMDLGGGGLRSSTFVHSASYIENSLAAYFSQR